MTRFRLLAGGHQDRKPILGPNDEIVGHKTTDYSFSDPNNCIVDSEDDLVAKYGRNKFENLDGPNSGGTGDSLFNQHVEAEVKRRLKALGLEDSEETSNETKVDTAPKLTPETEAHSVFKREELEVLSMNKLKKIADDSEIDISTAFSKEEVVNTILAAT